MSDQLVTSTIAAVGTVEILILDLLEWIADTYPPHVRDPSRERDLGPGMTACAHSARRPESLAAGASRRPGTRRERATH